MKVRISVVTTFLALAFLPSVAVADSGGATINTLPDSTQLEGHVEVEHECSASRCFWFGEAAQYPASIECPAVFDITHSVWVGSEEESTEASSGSFPFTPEATVVHLCLYINEEGSSLVGQSHPFSTQTGGEVLPQPPKRQATRAVLTVKVFDRCKAHIYADARGGGEDERGGTWSGAELLAPRKAKLLAASRQQRWFWTIEGPVGSYRFSAHFDGNAVLLPSSPATVAFRLRRCTK